VFLVYIQPCCPLVSGSDISENCNSHNRQRQYSSFSRLTAIFVSKGRTCTFSCAWRAKCIGMQRNALLENAFWLNVHVWPLETKMAVGHENNEYVCTQSWLSKTLGPITALVISNIPNCNIYKCSRQFYVLYLVFTFALCNCTCAQHNLHKCLTQSAQVLNTICTSA
jgi:hypothetical protein